jgi:hypothetical protein
MLKRNEFVDPRMKYTSEEIAEYNLKAYNNAVHPMQRVVGQDKWVPPNLRKQIAKQGKN